jgi:prepilin peptidase CpaA
MTWIVMAVLGMLAIAGDLTRRSIPNWLTGGGIAAGLACHLTASGWRGVELSAAGATLGFALLLPLHMKGAMGGGDVKLMAAFGALLGPAGVLLGALLGAIAGGLWAALWMAVRPGTRAIPYAPAIVLGAWFSFLGGSFK